MADKQPPNNQAMRKLPMRPLSTTAYRTNTSKQKKIHEKQTEKRELDWAMLQGGALGTSWSAAERERGKDLEVVIVQIFKRSHRSSQSYQLQLWAVVTHVNHKYVQAEIWTAMQMWEQFYLMCNNLSDLSGSILNSTPQKWQCSLWLHLVQIYVQ